MATSVINLSKYSAAGVYTIYVDATQSPALIGNQILRLVVGFSRNGVFNAPVYIDANDKKRFRAIFGEVDRNLEKLGSFFHRSAEMALEAGPILALNLLNLNNTTSGDEPTAAADVVNYRSFSLDVAAKNGINRNKLFSSFYNKDNFWFPDEDKFLSTRANQDSGKLFNLVNLSQNPCTLITRKSTVTGFDISAREWYSIQGKNIPDYVRPDDLISDYFIDVIVLNGNYGPDRYNQLAKDPVFGAYFNADGLVSSTIDSFLDQPEVSLRAIYSGCIIPKFVDLEGKTRYIEDIINSDVTSNGILCAIDTTELNNFTGGTNTNYLDTVGHRFLTEDVQAIDMLSYKGKAEETLIYENNPGTDLVFTNPGIMDGGSDENLASVSITLGGSSGSVDSVIIDGVTITSGAVNFNTSPSQTATDLAADITSNTSSPDYNATASGAVVTITGDTLSGSTPNGNAVTVNTTTMTAALSSSTMSGGVDESKASVVISLDEGTSGQVSEIDILGVNILSQNIPFNTSINQTVADIVAEINSNTSSPDYNAVASGNSITITAAAGAGDTPNGYAVSIATVAQGKYAVAANGTVFTENTGNNTFIVKVPSTHASYQTLYNLLAVGDIFDGTRTSAGLSAGVPIANPGLEVAKVSKTASSVTFSVTSLYKANETVASGSFVDMLIDSGDYKVSLVRNSLKEDSTDTFFVADKDSEVYKDFKAGTITNGDVISDGTDNYYLKFTETRDNDLEWNDNREVLKIELFTDSALSVPISTGNLVGFTDSYDASGFAVTSGVAIISASGGFRTRYDATFVDSKTIRVAIANEANIATTDYIRAVDSNGNPVLSRISRIKRYGSPTPTHIEITSILDAVALSGSNGDQIEVYKPFESFLTNFDATHLAGFKVNTSHMPNNTTARTNEIYGVMEDTNLFSALTDSDMINFRYIVDTFNNGLETGSKSILTRLAKGRQKCMALCNTPSFKEFGDSLNPRFTDSATPADPEPAMNVRYIKDGGNLSENPEFLYTMPTKDQGADFAGFFTPNILIQDGDGVVSMPPAALVSNQFMQKHSNNQPFSAVAGIRRGILSTTGIQGVEYQLSITDRGHLEDKGINPIYRRNDGNIVVFGNRTAYQTLASSLNQLHVRDLLISVQTESERILRNYLFEFNDNSIRNEIKTLLDSYLTTLQNGYNAIQEFEVTMDATNNPEAAANSNIGIVDISITPTGVYSVFINRITITNSGGVSSGGFVSA